MFAEDLPFPPHSSVVYYTLRDQALEDADWVAQYSSTARQPCVQVDTRVASIAPRRSRMFSVHGVGVRLESVGDSAEHKFKIPGA